MTEPTPAEQARRELERRARRELAWALLGAGLALLIWWTA